MDSLMQSLRPATNADEAEARALLYQVLAEYGLTPDPDGADSDLDDIEANYFDRGGYFGVIEQDGKMIATVGLWPMSEEEIELRKMYLLPEARGRGLGTKLLMEMFTRARKRGYQRMSLETASQLKEAIGLYKKHGFERVYPEHLTDRCDQAYVFEL